MLQKIDVGGWRRRHGDSTRRGEAAASEEKMTGLP